MKFVVIGRDSPEGKEKRKIFREKHLKRLKEVDGAGRLILAGPFKDGSGSLIVIEAECIEDAEAFIKADPYVTEGVFATYEIRPFILVFPEESSNE